jgi:hypothetical protein
MLITISIYPKHKTYSKRNRAPPLSMKVFVIKGLKIPGFCSILIKYRYPMNPPCKSQLMIFLTPLDTTYPPLDLY